MVILCRYLGAKKQDYLQELSTISRMEKKVEQAEIITEVMGYEGYASRIYFDLLNRVIKPEFRFNGRNRRPPRDPFNSLLNMSLRKFIFLIIF